MTKEQQELLLTVARTLRAKIMNEVYAERDDDLWALNEALLPFDGVPFAEIFNGCSSEWPRQND